MTDRDWGITVLRYWFEGSFKLYSFQDAIAYYDNLNPNFIPALGKACRGLKQSQVKDSLISFAQENGANYPRPQDFLGQLAKDVGVSVGDIVSAVGDGVFQWADLMGNIGKWAVIGLGLYLLIQLSQDKALMKRMKLA
jgi:hypothetical protein